MKFRTEVEFYTSGFTLEPGDGIVLLGSCFSDEIGKKLYEDKFNCSINPFGVLYNPASILQALEILASTANGNKVVDDDFIEKYFFQSNGHWLSWLHSSAFTAYNLEDFTKLIRQSIANAADCLAKAKTLIITFGTNRVYLHKTGGEETIVANCHKQPGKDFSTIDLEPIQIKEEFVRMVDTLTKINPGLHILFTVSPYRYTKYGLHGSNLSKAALLLAEDYIIKSRPHTCQYFPSYEILNDELRDYRFYAEDMVHPSAQAVNYIYEKVKATLFGNKAKQFAEEWEPLKKTLQHRPLFPNSNDYKTLMLKTQKDIIELKNKYPRVNLEHELKLTEQKLSQQA